MPFKSFRVLIQPGTAEKVHSAAGADAEVTIRSVPLPGQGQASNGYNFTVGGPELEDNPGGGLFCFDSDFSTAVEAGDELWAGIPEESPWTNAAVALTVLVRSKGKTAVRTSRQKQGE